MDREFKKDCLELEEKLKQLENPHEYYMKAAANATANAQAIAVASRQSLSTPMERKPRLSVIRKTGANWPEAGA